MKDEVAQWQKYADENYKSAELLLANSLIIDLTDDECEFLNSIYLPSKYPLGSVLADFEPDYEICKEALGIAEKVIRSVKGILND